MELLSLRSLFLAIGVFVVYLVVGAVYRLYFSPLAKFPGPKLAALTLWYEFYYDVVKKGRYSWEIGKMHEIYGPIVRINPYEIHINDPEYIDEVYPGSSRRTMKYGWATKMFGRGTSVFATESHELHRIRRGALASFFSKGSVLRLEPTVQSVIDKLLDRLRKLQGSGTNINVIDVYSSLTADIISLYAFARSYNLLDDPDFSPFWPQIIAETSMNSHTLKHLGWVEPLMRNMPLWLVKILNPHMMTLITWQDTLRSQVRQVMKELKENSKVTDNTTIFYDMLTREGARPEERTEDHLTTEAQLVMAAGTVTTAHTLSVLTFHVLNNPDILQRLQKELSTVLKGAHSPPKWQQLEALPYLTAIINESLRVGYGAAHRLQRISPDVPLHYKEWTIPVGTPVSMTSMLLHDNPNIFPNPRTFSPDRWLESSNTRLQRYIVPFSRGTRQCAGRDLAYCEIYLTVAAMFAPGRFNFKLFETDMTDVEIKHDFFNPFFRLDSKGIRVLVE